jgi:putative two-component system response regulator
MSPPENQLSRILIVDDEPANVALLERILTNHGYTNLKAVSDSRRTLDQYKAFAPDIILLDLHMPHLDGFTVMRQLQPFLATGPFLPILVLTADVTSETRERALVNGAKDFLVKPFDAVEVILRIENLLETRRLHRALYHENRVLDERVRARTLDLEDSRLETLERLAIAAEYRDDDTRGHIRRVGENAMHLARALNLPDDQVEMLRRAAPLHDLGKIGVPDAILLKPGKLTPQEFEVMKTHTTIGANILSGARSPLLQLAEVIARSHHERWDGTGYARMEGDKIPFAGRIIAVVDTFDALTNERPYKPAWSVDDAAAEIARQSGRHFDPHIAEAFLDVLERHDLLSQRRPA